MRFAAEISAAAAAHGLDPRLLAAVAAQETGGPGSNSGNNIVGDSGHGRGVFQIDDRSWVFARTPAAMDPAQNAQMAASILADGLQRYGGNVRAALNAYNTGSPSAAGTTTTWGDGQTLGYADSVLRHYTELGSDTQAQLMADNRQTSSDVNSLANFSATLPPPLAATFEPAPPLTYNGAAQQDATAVGAEADKDLGNLVGGDDVFDSDEQAGT
jgi:hypothetical protein